MRSFTSIVILASVATSIALVSGGCGSDPAVEGTPSTDGGPGADSGTPSGDSGTDPGATSFSVGGTVKGLVGAGLVLQNNGKDDLALSADGKFAFAGKIDKGGAFDVTIKSQPTKPNQVCVVTGGKGTIAAGNVSSVVVNCTTNQHTVSGSVSGLDGSGLVLTNGGGKDVAISANGAFSFEPQDDGSAYDVTVKTPPSNKSQTCVVTNGKGTIASADVSGVAVACTTNKYKIGATVTGLTGPSVVLTNGADEATRTANGAFTFTTEVLSGGAYDIKVKTQPDNQYCTVTGGTGTVGGANVNATVACAKLPADCAEIKRTNAAAANGVYWIGPKGTAFQAYCDMTTDGGGWTMCYTEKDNPVHIKAETAYTGQYGTMGYRTDCRDISFNSVLYVDHDNNKKSWFARESGEPIVLEGGIGFNAAGSAAGRFYGYGDAKTDWLYQLNACDDGWMWVGLMMSGFTNNCSKQCGSWCGDVTSDYYRTDGDVPPNQLNLYKGVAFAENGHTNVTAKTMSVGVRNWAKDTICASPLEGGTATITCPAGKTIKTIDYASYGTPNGTCGAFVNGACNAAGTKAVVEAACLNQATCTVGANNGVFGDPCGGTFKRLNVQATCQ